MLIYFVLLQQHYRTVSGHAVWQVWTDCTEESPKRQANRHAPGCSICQVSTYLVLYSFIFQKQLVITFETSVMVVSKAFFMLSIVCFSCRFDRRDEAQEAINSLNGVIPENGTEPLVVKIAEEHGKQKAAYYAGWQAGYNQSRGKYPASSFPNLCGLL